MIVVSVAVCARGHGSTAHWASPYGMLARIPLRATGLNVKMALISGVVYLAWGLRPFYRVSLAFLLHPRFHLCILAEIVINK